MDASQSIFSSENGFGGIQQDSLDPEHGATMRSVGGVDFGTSTMSAMPRVMFGVNVHDRMDTLGSPEFRSSIDMCTPSVQVHSKQSAPSHGFSSFECTPMLQNGVSNDSLECNSHLGIQEPNPEYAESDFSSKMDTVEDGLQGIDFGTQPTFDRSIFPGGAETFVTFAGGFIMFLSSLLI